MALLVKDILPHLFERKIDWRMALLQHWNTVVGTLKTRIRLEKIYDDTLVIGVYESHWMQELHLLSSVLIESINTFLGEERVHHLRFMLVEEKRLVKKEKRTKQHEKLPEPKLNRFQNKALEEIADEQLKAALAKFWARCMIQK